MVALVCGHWKFAHNETKFVIGNAVRGVKEVNGLLRTAKLMNIQLLLTMLNVTFQLPQVSICHFLLYFEAILPHVLAVSVSVLLL